MKSKFGVIALGLALGALSLTAFADQPGQAPACTSDEIPGVLAPQYDPYGRLIAIDDLAGKSHVRIQFRGDALDEISITHFIKARTAPDKYGRMEDWGPSRWSEYNLKTGRLSVVHIYRVIPVTHELTKNGKTVTVTRKEQRQLTFTIPADADLSSGRFTGAPEACDIMYEDCRTLEPETLALTEPVTVKPGDTGSCLSFGGARVALRKQAEPALSKIEDASGDTKTVPADKPEQLAPAGRSHKVCVDGLCAIVYDDDKGDSGDGQTDVQ